MSKHECAIQWNDYFQRFGIRCKDCGVVVGEAKSQAYAEKLASNHSHWAKIREERAVSGAQLRAEWQSGRRS